MKKIVYFFLGWDVVRVYNGYYFLSFRLVFFFLMFIDYVIMDEYSIYMLM